MDRRDWVYLLSLLIPFAVYNLVLKFSGLPLLPNHGLEQSLSLMLPTALFNLGYVIFWVGLFSVVRKSRRSLRWTVVGLFHFMTVLVMAVTTCAYQYSRETGTTLDFSTLAEWIPKFKEISPPLLGDVPLSTRMVVAVAIIYALFGPWLITHTLGHWRGWTRRYRAETAHETSLLSPLALFLLGIGFGALSVLISTTTLARDPFINVVATGLNGASSKDNWDPEPAIGHPAARVSLAQTPKTDKRNVVLIHLESTRARSTTPYNEDLKTMPFLDELAKNSLLAEQAYVVLPLTAKGSLAVNCGVEPPLYSGPEFGPSGIPDRCLADLLNEQGYRTAFFQSTWNDGFSNLTKNFGYKEFYPYQSMDTEGFQWTNTFGYEDDIMLRPSEGWLRAYGYDKPFMVEYLTSTGHYGYECIPNRYGTKDFSEDEQLNRYLNCLRYLDFFLNNLFDQYKKLGLYDNTIFVIFGDHGEGFGEHDRFLHGDTIYEEGLRIPLIIHAPGWFEGGQREGGLSSQIDILPTVLEILGYEVKNGKYPGYSLLHPVPEDRTLMFSCISSFKCLASLKGEEKYVYNYGNQPDEVFNLSKDPLEENNLASLYSKEELDKRREDLLAWRSKVDTEYGDTLINGTLYSKE